MPPGKFWRLDQQFSAQRVFLTVTLRECQNALKYGANRDFIIIHIFVTADHFYEQKFTMLALSPGSNRFSCHPPP